MEFLENTNFAIKYGIPRKHKFFDKIWNFSKTQIFREKTEFLENTNFSIKYGIPQKHNYFDKIRNFSKTQILREHLSFQIRNFSKTQAASGWLFRWTEVGCMKIKNIKMSILEKVCWTREAVAQW